MQDTWIWSLGQEDPLEKGRLPILVFLPGQFHGQRILAGYSPWGHKKSDATNTNTASFTFFQKIQIAHSLSSPTVIVQMSLLQRGLPCFLYFKFPPTPIPAFPTPLPCYISLCNTFYHQKHHGTLFGFNANYLVSSLNSMKFMNSWKLHQGRAFGSFVLWHILLALTTELSSSTACCNPWGHKESDMTGPLN